MAAAHLTCAVSAIFIVYVTGFAEFDLFHGFDGYDTHGTDRTTAAMETLAIEKFLDTATLESKTSLQSSPSTSPPSVATDKLGTFFCPEEEKPANIGPYEVPTQLDLVKQMKANLMTLFQSYHAKTLLFLEDIQKATRATASIAQKCHSKNREVYKQCVKHVNNQCTVITKSLVKSLEYQRHDVFAITDDKICNITAMKIDPVELIKVLAMEVASLEFALPGFLRLLHACSLYCGSSKLNGTDGNFRPTSTRRLSDQDLVVRHFLARKGNERLMKEPLK